jgi:hypothetical protein
MILKKYGFKLIQSLIKKELEYIHKLTLSIGDLHS